MYIRDLLKPKVAEGYTLRSDNPETAASPENSVNPLEIELLPIQVLRYGMPYLWN